MHSSFSTSCERRRRRSSAFTLLEVLLSIAIIALLATVLVGGSARLLSEQPVSADEVFWKAVQESRKTALKAEHDIRLKFDKEKRQFLLIDGLAPSAQMVDGILVEEKPLKTFAVPATAGTDVSVEFLAAGSKGGPAILVAGVLLESRTIPYVTFYSDGTCSAFRVQIARAGGAHSLAIDQWTCAPILTPPDPNAPAAGAGQE